MHVLCALSRILSAERPCALHDTSFQSQFQAHLQNYQIPDCSCLMDQVGLRIEQAVKVHCNQCFDRTDLEARCRNCCKEELELDHKNHAPDLHHSLHNLSHARNRLCHGVGRHLYCLAENGDRICRVQDLAENRPAEQGCHMVHRTDDVDSFQNLKWVSSDMLL